MLFDYVLIFGVLAVALGILRFLTLMITKTNPLIGVLMVILGVSCVFWASTMKEGPLRSTDFANSVYKIIGSFK